MTRRLLLFSSIMYLLCVGFAESSADEGMWLLDALTQLPMKEMKKHGLELTPEQIYSTTAPSLKDAIMLLSGGTAGFVSADGLILTNHHVAFGGIQALSSVKDDYLQNGFLAMTRDEELSTSYMAQMVVDMKDVTDKVLSATSASMSADERTREIRLKKLEIEEAMVDTAGYVHSVIEMYEGLKYYLFTFKQLHDIRLVYAPPGAIGNFGGETDNWVWPRHTGDFALMRAYVGPQGIPANYAKENIPYKPKMFLPISAQGHAEGSFAMILGFPGRTYRYQESSAIQLSRDETLPTTIDLYKTRMDVMQKAGDDNRAVGIKYAAKLRRLANTYKKSLGIIEGMKRTNLFALKQSEETKFAAYVASSAERTRDYGSLLADMQRASQEIQKVNIKNILLTNFSSGVALLSIANRFVDFVGSLRKDSLGKVLEPTEKERAHVKERVGGILKDVDPTVDKETLIALMLRSADIPAEQQFTLVREIVGGRTGRERENKVREYVDDLYKDTWLGTQAGCEKLLMEDVNRINEDAFVRFARNLAHEHGAVQSSVGRAQAALAQLRTKFVQAQLQWKNGTVHYPDANRTLRFTYGQVESIAPRDALHLACVTTLTGVMEKETGQAPFVVPQQLKDLWRAKNFGRYADPQLGDVPVGFITNLDITGGNSGSPVLNGKGELIGCAFDGNWEGVVGDYQYEEKYDRTISVDARYILFILDKFSGAENILKELVIH
jgi:hypothetical protein